MSIHDILIIGDNMIVKCDNRKINRKGFTLIELLAVIVILGVLMIVAIPQVTKYINNSKKDAFVKSAVAYISSARYSLLNDEYDQVLPVKAGDTVCIPLSFVDIEKASNSPYGAAYDTTGSYVIAKNVDGKVEYSIYLLDGKGYGTKVSGSEVAIPESTLTGKTSEQRSVISSGISKKTCSGTGSGTGIVASKS